MLTLEQLIARVPPDYTWLLREGRPGEFPNDQGPAFCHISHKSAVALLGGEMIGRSIKCWAATPVEAMAACLRELGVGMAVQ